MLDPQPHTLPTRKQLRRLENILDLASIHLIRRQSIQILPAEVVLFRPAGSGQEIAPDVSARGDAEFFVLHAYVDARLEGGVDVVHAVGGEEEDAFVIFEDAQEYGNELVAFEVVGASSVRSLEVSIAVECEEQGSRSSLAAKREIPIRGFKDKSHKSWTGTDKENTTWGSRTARGRHRPHQEEGPHSISWPFRGRWREKIRLP